jgi:hypothetical protein
VRTFAPDGIASFAEAKARRLMENIFPVANLRDIIVNIQLPTLAMMMSEKHGGVAAQLLAQFGGDAIPTLLAVSRLAE